jgi:hypothetical protein
MTCAFVPDTGVRLSVGALGVVRSHRERREEEVVVREAPGRAKEAERPHVLEPTSER